MKHLGFLLPFLLAGCASLTTENFKPADAAQTTAPPAPSTTAEKAKAKQWFTTDTPETLPKDKLEKMNLGGPGGFGGY